MRVSPQILIVGAGNDYMGDDGAGSAVIQKLTELEVNHIDLFNCGTDLFRLATIEKVYDAILIVDAVTSGKSPGSIHWFTPNHVDNFRLNDSVHQLSVLEVLKLLPIMNPQLEPVSFYMVGIEPGDIAFQQHLTEQVAEAVRHIIKQLKTKNGVQTAIQWCLESVIESPVEISKGTMR